LPRKRRTKLRAMRPRERRETSEQDVFRSRLDQIIDMKHALVMLARTIDWGFLEQTFGAVYTDKPGQPPLPDGGASARSISSSEKNHGLRFEGILRVL
jgi:hypothetical protein